MTDLKKMVSDLESLASEVDYDMVDYDQSKVDALADAVKAMEDKVIEVFGVEYFHLNSIIHHAAMVSDTDRDEWEGNNF